MNVSITLNEMTVEHANAVLALLAELNGVKLMTDEPAQPQEGAPLFDEPATVQAEESSAPETSDNPASFTIEQVRAAFTKYAKTNGKAAAKELLTKYGAGKVTELKESDYAAVMKEVS